MTPFEDLSLDLNYNLQIDYDIAKTYYEQLITHISYVQEFGKQLNVPESQLLKHDESKFSSAEFPFYAQYFHGGKLDEDKPAFARAWLHHVHHNPHHPEHWYLTPDYNFADTKDGCFPMPEKYVREMVADWMSASKVYTGSENMTEWLRENLKRFYLHDTTKSLLVEVLAELGYTIRQVKIGETWKTGEIVI